MNHTNQHLKLYAIKYLNLIVVLLIYDLVGSV